MFHLSLSSVFYLFIFLYVFVYFSGSLWLQSEWYWNVVVYYMGGNEIQRDYTNSMFSWYISLALLLPNS